MNNHRPRSLRRELKRWTLIRRARRVAFEREWLELEEFLEAIRQSAHTQEMRKLYADEVE